MVAGEKTKERSFVRRRDLKLALAQPLSRFVSIRSIYNGPQVRAARVHYYSPADLALPALFCCPSARPVLLVVPSLPLPRPSCTLSRIAIALYSLSNL